MAKDYDLYMKILKSRTAEEVINYLESSNAVVMELSSSWWSDDSAAENGKKFK